MTTPKHVADREMAASIRGWIKTLCLWRLCANQACRRARACRGKPRACFRPNFVLLPPEVQAWWFEFGRCQDEGLSFEAACERLEAEGFSDAFVAWCRNVEAQLQPPDRAAGPAG